MILALFTPFARMNAWPRLLRPLAAVAAAALAAAGGLLSAPAAAWAQSPTAATPAPAAPLRTELPATVLQALARAGVPADAMAAMVAPLPPPPGAVSPLPEPVNPSGEQNPAPHPAGISAPPARLAWRADVAMNPASVMKLVTSKVYRRIFLKS